MSQNPPARMHGLQTPLPLVDPEEDAATRAAADAEWRLDDHTREVGRRGIAEARARLAAARRGGRGRGGGPSEGTPGRAPGRAA
jgi:hypothetical protein